MDTDTINARMNRLQKAGNIGNWEVDLKTGKATWSEEACRIYGVQPEEHIVSLDAWEKFIHPEDVVRMHEAFHQARLNKKSYEIQYRIVRRDNSERYIYAHVEIELDEEQQPVALYGIVNDITELILLKNELLKSEGNMRLMMDLIPVSVYARDANGYYLFANHVFLNHYGITYEQLKGKHLRDFVRSEEEYRILLAQDQAVLASNTRLYVPEFRQTDHNGRLTIWKIIKVPFMPEGHTTMAVLGIAEDITEQQLREEDLRKVADTLAARNRALEQYSFMVSHDLRGPLSTLMGMSNLIKNMKLSQDDLNVFFEGIDCTLGKLDDIVRKMNEVLAESKL
jgi:PAS domain S-box-containing protein